MRHDECVPIGHVPRSPRARAGEREDVRRLPGGGSAALNAGDVGAYEAASAAEKAAGKQGVDAAQNAADHAADGAAEKAAGDPVADVAEDLPMAGTAESAAGLAGGPADGPDRDGVFEHAVGVTPGGGRWVAALRDIILGGQDGLVNVLGLVLGMAAATGDTRVIVTAGAAAMMAESIAMAGVAFTATGAEGAWARQRGAHLLERMRARSLAAARTRRATLASAGWSADRIADVERLMEEERIAWSRDVDEMHAELAPVRETRPATAALTVGLATLVGSAVPLSPFVFLPVGTAIPVAILLAAVVLATAGVLRGRAVGSGSLRASLEMTGIGLLSALAGYLIGLALRAPAAG
jgi:vacuolar iron transporter family protein